MKKIFVVIIVTVMFIPRVFSQNFAYKLDFGFLFDNLEGCEEYTPTRSLLAVKLAPEVGININNKHTFMVGASMLQNLGESKFLSDADYIIYYKYHNPKFNVFAGSFPRNNTKGNYPRNFFRDDFLFTDNNIEGLMFQYTPQRQKGFIEFYADWYGQEQAKRTDEFLLTVSSEYKFFDDLFIVGGNLFLNHYKNIDVLTDCGLYERFYYNLYLGTDLKKFMPALNRFRVSVGTNSSAENKRNEVDGEKPWDNNIGLQFDVDVNWKGAGVRNEFYVGNPQMIYYKQFGDMMYWGSQFYQSDLYNFTELYYEKTWKFISVKAGMMFHVTPTTFANQQVLTLKFNLHSMLKKGKIVNL